MFKGVLKKARTILTRASSKIHKAFITIDMIMKINHYEVQERVRGPVEDK